MFRRFHRTIFSFFFVSTVFFVALPAYALVDINSAGVEELDSLYGIGPAKAQDIIDYRNGPNGPFETIEEIMEVSGIGTATFDKIKNDITVITQTQTDETIVAEDQEETLPSASAPSASGGGVFIEDTKSISVDGGLDRTVFVGADSVFEARVTGAVGEPVTNAHVVWSFGNGERKIGQSVLYNFAFPGDYTVVVDASNDVYGATDRVRVKAIPALLTISEVTSDYIALRNDTDVEVDVGGWLLFSLGRQFQFPEHTIITANQEVLISNKRTGLVGTDPSTVVLQYPNGLVATAYQYPLFLAQRSNVSVPQGVPNSGASPGALRAPGEASLVSQNNLITSPIAATGGNFGMWPWLIGIGTIAGLGSGLIVYARRRERGYAVEEIS